MKRAKLPVERRVRVKRRRRSEPGESADKRKRTVVSGSQGETLSSPAATFASRHGGDIRLKRFCFAFVAFSEVSGEVAYGNSTSYIWTRV